MINFHKYGIEMDIYIWLLGQDFRIACVIRVLRVEKVAKPMNFLTEELF
jgi:hypothetical protein